MTCHYFALQPFSSLPTSQMEVTGSIARLSNQLSIRYEARGEIENMMISDFADQPIREIGLWQGTCFELFLAEKDAEGYWEFNLSPSGHWNVFHFADYRQGMQEETAFASLPFDVRKGSSALALELVFCLDGIVEADRALKAGISAVIKQKDDALTYWALTHSRSHPDFHDPAGFILKL